MKSHKDGEVNFKYKIFLFFVGLIFSVNVQALTITVNSKNLTNEEFTAASDLVKQAMAALPPLVIEKMQTHLNLEFKDLGKEGRWGLAQHMIFEDNKLYLDKSLLPDIVAGENKSRQNLKWATRYRSFYNIALGTILHEVAHFFDEWHSSPLSSSPEFLHLNYFKNDHSKSNNTLAAKSPNWYEFSSAAESFAVNFEFFLLDPEFKCHKPLLFDFFSTKIFKYIPFPKSSCTMVNKVFETANILENGRSDFVDFDFKRLYQVHYLLADKGSDISSKWGHSMIRFVFCAPERTSKGPDCLKDLSYHKVLSFRAAPTSDSVSVLKGLTGKYPSFLYVLPLTQIIVDYTVDELRPLKSVPLNLSEEQMKKVFLRALEVHWSYRGKYYFINNNCAVETLNLIKTVLPEKTDLENLDAITPQGVLDILSEVGIADVSNFSDLQAAWKKGLYYYPNDKIPKLAFLKLQKSSNQLADTALEDFLFKSKPSERNNIYQEIVGQTFQSKEDLKEFYASAMYLEKQISKRLKKKLYNDAMLKLVEIDDQEKSVRNKVITWTDFWYSGYGVPTDQDYQDYYVTTNTLKQSQQKEFTDSLKKKVETFWDSETKNDYLKSQENMNYIRTVYEKQIETLR